MAASTSFFRYNTPRERRWSGPAAGHGQAGGSTARKDDLFIVIGWMEWAGRETFRFARSQILQCKHLRQHDVCAAQMGGRF